MAFIECSFYSSVLEMECSANIILPLGRKNIDYTQKKENIPVLYLLHGYTEDHTAWTRRTSVERYAMEMNIAIVMPNVHRSFYIDSKNGMQYFKFVSEELPELMSNMFGLSDKREDCFAAGLSMGGYGALKMALTYPDKFCMAASFSGLVDINRITYDEQHKKEVDAMLGGQIDDCNDLYKLAENAENLPYIYQACGTDDFMYQDNKKFADFMKKINPNFTYYEESGVAHTWDFWDRQIKKTLETIKSMNDRI